MPSYWFILLHCLTEGDRDRLRLFELIASDDFPSTMVSFLWVHWAECCASCEPAHWCHRHFPIIVTIANYAQRPKTKGDLHSTCRGRTFNRVPHAYHDFFSPHDPNLSDSAIEYIDISNIVNWLDCFYIFLSHTRETSCTRTKSAPINSIANYVIPL